MPIYTYKGYDVATGANRKGKIEAESVKSARARLRQKEKIIVSDIKEEASLKGMTKKGQANLFSARVALSDLSVMTRQFATLMAAHVPLDESLKALAAQVDNKVLASTLSAVKDKVSEGISLAEASREYPGVFNQLYVNMVRAGESSGKLDIVLERLAQFLEEQNKARGQVLSAITYPAVMILASSGLIAFLFMSIVPKLQKVFDSLRVVLPWYTKMCIGISAALQNYWYLFVLVGVGGYFGFLAWVKSPEGREKYDRWVLKIPVFGGIIMRMMVARFTKTLSTLLNSGVPIVQALEITKNVITNSYIADVIENAKIAVQEGQSLGRTIERSNRFPALVTQMIMTGERTGELESMLGHVAIAYDAEVERKIEAMISLIEPAMIIVLGGITVVVVFSLMIPMLSVMNNMRH